MPEPRIPYLNIDDLRGGVNDSDSKFSLPLNQVVGAFNVDHREGMIGTKRKGLAPLSLSASVFERDLPVLQTSNVGGFAGAASGNIAISAGTNVDGTGVTNHILLAFIATKAATDVTAVDLSGTALTNLGQVSNGGAGRLEVFYLKTPAIGGGTLNVTLAGAADCAIIAERWINNDNTINPQNFASSTSGGAAVAQPSSASWNPQFMAQCGFAWQNTTTADGVGAGQIVETQQSNGNARVMSLSVVGMKPTTQFNITLGGAVPWIAFVWALRGRTIAMGTTPNRITALLRFTPTNTLSGDELWAQDLYGRIDRRMGGVWQTGVPAVNYAVGSFQTDGLHGTNAVSLHGKFFLALDGSLASDRLAVWDGTVLRWAGFATPTVLNAADRAGAGTYAGTRYFRFRYTEQQSGVTVRRSEPCATVTFVPSGVNTGATLTKPAAGGFLTGEGETHWEVEASTDGVLFYRITTLAVGTTTYDDLTVFATGYSSGSLSENIGEYVPPIAARHVVVDEDRLLVAGSQFSLLLDSRVSWTVLRADLGVGNDERVPVAQRHFTDLDGLSGGRITFITAGIVGSLYVFKLQRIYKMVRTGVSSRAYDTLTESEGRGSMLRAGCIGSDLKGIPCIFFVDPNVGPCMFGVNGVVDLAQQRRKTMKRINKAAGVSARTLFYPKEWLVWVWLTLDTQTYPTLVLCYNIRTNAWTDYTGPMSTSIAATLFPNGVSELRPYAAPTTLGTSLMCEADSGVNDDGVRFRGYVVTRPYQFGSLYRKFGIEGGTLHGQAAANVTAGVSLVRDYGVEQKNVLASLAPDGAETNVIQAMDDCVISECYFVHFELGDPTSYVGAQLDQTWTLDEFCAKFRFEEEA